MTRKLVCSTAIALIFIASSAAADVTPEEVWESWQALATSAGQELTVGEVARDGDTLKATGVALTYSDEMGGSASVSFDSLSFTDNGDGTVLVTMPESYPLSVAFPQQEDGPSSMNLTISQPGMKITAGGSATDTSYDVVAPTLTVTLDAITDENGAALDTKADMTMTNMAVKYLVARDGEVTALDSSFTAERMALNVAGADADGGGKGTIVLTMDALGGTTKGNFLGAEVMANMAAALNSGFTMDSSFTFGALAMNLDIEEAAGPTQMTASATGGGLVLAMNKDRMNYGTSLDGAKLTVSGAEIPFPQVDLGFSAFALNFLMPVSKSEAPQDFAFLAKVVDFTISDDVWGLFDPAGSLSREPATFVVDTKGTGFWKQDIMDPELAMDGVEPPGELNTLDLTEVRAKAAGAEVSATGGLTFDNTDLATFGGVPRPEGLITVTITGVNQLIDNLIAIGILSDDDAMGARMMLAMFARPGEGADQLISEIEFKEGGLFANGQRLQ